MKARNLFLALLAVAAFLSACTPVQTTRSGAVGVERKQYMLLSQQQAEQMAAAAYLQEKRAAAAKDKLNADQEQLARLRGIAQRLIPQTAVFREDALRWKWEVNLETSDEVNAYCAPGGKIMFYTGILYKLKLTDDEVAAVMGHEIAHALREHGRERLSEAYGQQMGMAVIAALGKMDDTKVALMQSITQVALALPHSRQQETEADRVGLELMARAGYNPRAALSLWRKMTTGGGSRMPEFLSTHPAPSSRMQEIEGLMPRVMPLYEETQKRPGKRREEPKTSPGLRKRR
jgi:Putative Zn-dependent protease, contains TPR repeats